MNDVFVDFIVNITVKSKNFTLSVFFLYKIVVLYQFEELMKMFELEQFALELDSLLKNLNDLRDSL